MFTIKSIHNENLKCITKIFDSCSLQDVSFEGKCNMTETVSFNSIFLTQTKGKLIFLDISI